MLEYLKSKRVKSPPPSDTSVEQPVLTAEDEDFLRRITEDVSIPASTALPPTPPPRPQELHEAGDTTGNNAQLVLSNLNTDSNQARSPVAEDVHSSIAQVDLDGSVTKTDKIKSPIKSKWNWLRKNNSDSKTQAASSDANRPAEGVKSSSSKSGPAEVVTDAEEKKEELEMAAALDQLNLAAVDNRAFSLSKETRELLAKFTLILKDLVNGVPTAYNDLESLITNSDDQLQKTYDHLPSALKKLVKKLPSKMGESITPEVLTAAAEKQSTKSKLTAKAAHGAGKAGFNVKVPSLKDLVTKPGAIAGMLKAIFNFLKLRFPAFLGLNVLYALGLFVLLLIFWYCHKRGKETRLEKERVATEDTIKSLDGDEDTSDTSSLRSSSSVADGGGIPHPNTSRSRPEQP